MPVPPEWISAPLTLVFATTLTSGPAAHVATSVRPLRLSTVVAPVPPGARNDDLLHGASVHR